MKYKLWISIWVCVLALVPTFLGGCTATPKKKINVNEIRVYPEPPEIPRIQYLTRFSGSSEFQYSNWLARFLGTLEPDSKSIMKPYGVAVAGKRIVVADTKLPGLDIFDLDKKTFTYFMPVGQGVLRKPVNVLITPKGEILVADTDRKEVVVYSRELRFERSFFAEGARPIDMALSGDTLYVTDLNHKLVQMWSYSSGKAIGTFPPNNESLPDSQQVKVPISIDVGSNGNVYVCDFSNFQIHEYDRAGNFIRNYGKHGQSLGNFARPKGIALDRENRLYVVDAAFENVQLFDAEGNLLMYFGGPYAGPGTMYLPASVEISYENLDYYRSYVLPGFELEYLIFVTNQFGPDKVSVFGFIKESSSGIHEITIPLPEDSPEESTPSSVAPGQPQEDQAEK